MYSEQEREESTVGNPFGGVSGGLSLSNTVGQTLILTHMRTEFVIGEQIYFQQN